MKKNHKVLKAVLGILTVLVLVVAIFASAMFIKANGWYRNVCDVPVSDTPMKFDVYGNRENPSVLILHGMYMDGTMLSYYGEALSDSYYVIIPTFHGMEGAEETVFKSFDGECRAIEAYAAESLGGNIDYAYGISMGATALYHLLQRGNVEVKTAILDGLYVAHQGLLAAYMTSTNYYTFHQQTLRGEDFDLGIMKIGCKLMGMSEEDAKDMFRNELTKNPMTLENMSRAAYANYTYQVDASAKIESPIVELWCGSLEPYTIKSNKLAKPQIRHCTERCFEGFGHGELVSKHKEECVQEMRRVFGE